MWQVPETHLRFIVGAIIGEGERKLVDEQTEMKLRSLGYQCDQLPAVEYVVMTSFPYKSTLSILVAFLKVYPSFRKYIQTMIIMEKQLSAHPMLEVYTEEEILFVAPLVRHADFYLPSVRQAEGEELKKSPDEETASSFTFPLASSSSASQLSDHSTDSSFEELHMEEAEPS
ncbi:TEX264 [Cordylochernes scorpioides]|uniref:TEX264 n=1 Tax=Cordylochernes scorpioides TaxID=51811 RepID=A0ABY6KC13_9ARAC|nr:TEX264 [Cordylochernes scorpioides]